MPDVTVAVVTALTPSSTTLAEYGLHLLAAFMILLGNVEQSGPCIHECVVFCIREYQAALWQAQIYW